MTVPARPVPLPTKRKYRDTDEVTLNDIRQAYITAAEVVQMDIKYLPIFERVERELHARETKTTSLDRARIAAQNGAHTE